MKGGKLLFLILNVILLVVLLELIGSVFSLSGDLFVFELIILVFLLLMSLDSMRQMSKGNDSGMGVMSIFFALVLINEVGLNVFANTSMNLSMLVIAALGFIITVLNHSDEKEYVEAEVAEQPVVEEIPEKVEEYYPGKFLASKTGKKYHEPKCEFAKKIPDKKQVWFDEKKAATKKGYKPCKCIKK